MKSTGSNVIFFIDCSRVRAASRKTAQDMMRRGEKKGAWEHFVKAIEITHAMVLEVIKVRMLNCT